MRPRQTSSLGRFWLAAGLLSLLLQAPSARADGPSLEDQVKSAFILNFAQFVDWPDASFEKADSPITIGILDSDTLAATLTQAVQGKTVHGRKVVLQKVDPAAPAKCHILILGGARPNTDILQTVASASLLTVGDADNFTDAGGIIRFYLEDRKLRFEINTAAADRAHLVVSSKLLKLAKVVSK